MSFLLFNVVDETMFCPFFSFLTITGQYLLFAVVAHDCLNDIQPMSRQALFTLHSDEECYSGASVVRLCG